MADSRAAPQVILLPSSLLHRRSRSSLASLDLLPWSGFAGAEARNFFFFYFFAFLAVPPPPLSVERFVGLLTGSRTQSALSFPARGPLEGPSLLHDVAAGNSCSATRPSPITILDLSCLDSVSAIRFACA